MHSSSYILAQQLGEILHARRKTISLAESCTGGALAKAITDVPGSSAWFEAGFITYSNAAKARILQVAPECIAQHGAVSLAVVEAMVEGALLASGADAALAVSGIAGPAGGTQVKPVGTVCIAVGNSQTQHAMRYRFIGDRSSVREQSVIQGLKNLLEFCVENLN